LLTVITYVNLSGMMKTQ